MILVRSVYSSERGELADIPWWQGFLWMQVHNTWTWLLRNGFWREREEGGYFRDCRIAHPRYWFRGRAPKWGKLR